MVRKPKCSTRSASRRDLPIKNNSSTIRHRSSCDKFYDVSSQHTRTTSLGFGNKYDFFKQYLFDHLEFTNLPLRQLTIWNQTLPMIRKRAWVLAKEEKKWKSQGHSLQHKKTKIQVRVLILQIRRLISSAIRCVEKVQSSIGKNSSCQVPAHVDDFLFRWSYVQPQRKGEVLLKQT